MLATIIIVVILLSAVSVVSFNLLSLSFNINESNEATLSDSELTIIKQTIISNSKAIESESFYSLPYGSDDASNNRHLLPTEFGTPLMNVKGYYFQYCPYGIDDTTTKDTPVTESDGSFYYVKNSTLNDIDYTTHSEAAPTPTDSPDSIRAIIISKIDSSEVLCDDVLYDINSGAYYMTDAKVSVITNAEINNYFRLNNLSGVQETLELDSTSVDTVFSTIQNDVSNKEYILSMTEDISLPSSYTISKDLNKRNKITIETNGFEFNGLNTLTFENLDLFILGDGATTETTPVYAKIFLDNVNAYFDNVNTGALDIESSNAVLNDTYIYSSSSQRTFISLNSEVLFSGTSYANVNNTVSNKAILEFKSSDVTFDESSDFYFLLNNYNPKHLIELKNSNLNLYGNISQDTLSVKYPSVAIRINHGSKFYLDGGELELPGNPYSQNPSIEVEGELVSGGSTSSRSYINLASSTNVSSLINIINGGSLKLDNIYIGQRSDGTDSAYPSGYMIEESSFTYTNNGASLLVGDNSVNIYHSSKKCWNGETFDNVDDVAKVNSDISSSDKVNNISAWECFD